MRALLLRRLAVSLLSLFVVSALVFILEAVTPGNAARSILGTGGTAQQYEQLRHQLGLDHAIYQQYWDYLEKIFHGSLGSSVINGQSVWTLIKSHVAATLWVTVGSTLFAGLLGIILGTFSAVFGGWLGRTIDILAFAGLSMPNFWLGLVLIEAFAVSWEIFPAVGYVSLSQGIGPWARSLVLPIIALGLGGVAGVAKAMRESMATALNADYVLTLRANGASWSSIIVRHALRNASIPVMSMIGLVFVGALSGVVFIEATFSLPGLGQLLVTAVSQHDIYVIEGIAMFFTLLVIIVSLLVDLSYAALNPKIRVG